MFRPRNLITPIKHIFFIGILLWTGIYNRFLPSFSPRILIITR